MITVIELNCQTSDDYTRIDYWFLLIQTHSTNVWSVSGQKFLMSRAGPFWLTLFQSLHINKHTNLYNLEVNTAILPILSTQKFPPLYLVKAFMCEISTETCTQTLSTCHSCVQMCTESTSWEHCSNGIIPFMREWKSKKHETNLKQQEGIQGGKKRAGHCCVAVVLYGRKVSNRSYYAYKINILFSTVQ